MKTKQIHPDNETAQEILAMHRHTPGARIECRSVLWGSAVWLGEKIVTHHTLEEAISRIESTTPPVSQKIQGGEINFYTIPHGEMVATVRCYIVPNPARATGETTEGKANP